MPATPTEGSSQLPPKLVVAVTVLIVVGEPLKLMATLCGAAFPPVCAVKVTGFGVAVKPLPDGPPAQEPKQRVSGTCTVPELVRRVSVAWLVPGEMMELFTVRVRFSLLMAELTNMGVVPGFTINVAPMIGTWMPFNVTEMVCEEGLACPGAFSLKTTVLGLAIRPFAVPGFPGALP